MPAGTALRDRVERALPKVAAALTGAGEGAGAVSILARAGLSGPRARIG